MINTILEVRDEIGVDDPFMMTIATTGGDGLWCARFAVGATAPSLYWGRGLSIRNCDSSSTHLAESATVVVSEPLDTEEFVWHEVPEHSLVQVDGDGVRVELLEGVTTRAGADA